MKTYTRFLSLLAAALCAFASMPQRAQAVDFKEDIQPILRSKCFKCHSGPKAKGGLRMDSTIHFQKRVGTDEDADVVPGHPEKSLMVKKASLPRNDTDAMPPPGRGDPLTAVELGRIKTWISEGASFEASEDKSETGDDKPAVDMSKMYTWTNTKGQSLEAAFVKLNGKAVVLRKEDGTEFEYPMTNLGAESRKQAKDLSLGQ